MATLAQPRILMNAERRFFTGMAAAMLVTVFIGFAPTYYLFPWFEGVTARGVAAGANLTPLVHAHAAILSAWMLLYVTQTGLVSARRVDLHRALGIAGVNPCADGDRCRHLAGNRFRAPREHAAGWPNAEAFLPVPLFSIVLFAGFTTAGLAWRRRPDYHKRLMLLGTMAMLVPALARIVRMTQPPFLPFGVRGGVAVLHLYLLALIVFDLSRRGRLHPVTAWGAAIFLVTWPFRLTIGYTEPWQAFAHALLN
jgi:hypothetical protein